jgi:uncharacterized alkaline shock family protein YloU
MMQRLSMAGEITPIGSIHIAPQAIATIAYQAVLQSYGVVGLASKNLIDGLTSALVKDPTHGIEVRSDGEGITIEIYVIVEYGTRIKSVANSVGNTVRFHVEKALGMPVHQVNVHVRGLRVSNLD